MKILLVNDDGYGAEGLMALYEALKDGHEVMIIAPEVEHSGAGHSVTLRKEIRAKKMPLGYAVTGTPADCAKLGIRHLMKDCELVISGINPGANLGMDANYSGTVAAAREAALQGKQALAASCYCRRFRDVAFLAEYTVQVAEKLMENPLPKGTFLNLNMPNVTREQGMTAEAAPMGWHIYAEEFAMREAEDGSGDFVFAPMYGKDVLMQQGHVDNILVREGIATLTTVSWDATHFPTFHTALKIAKEMKDAGNVLA